MKINMNKILLTVALSASFLALSSSCQKFDDVLDKKPLDEVSPDAYFKTASQLRTFTINKYTSFWTPQGQWFSGMYRLDDNTDNSAYYNEPPRKMFSLEHWKVPSNGGLGMKTIRELNWFLEKVVPEYEKGAISGDPVETKQCLGEAYFFRAFHYFGKLKTYGDFPIVKKVLNDNEAELQEAAKRMPRNEVARFILDDLNKAIDLLGENVSNKQRINKNVARLFKSRVALYEGTFEKYHQGSGRVPGDANWPGKDKEWNKGKTFNIDSEVKFFLGEAKKEAKIVADACPLVESNHQLDPNAGQTSGWNPYYDMFASINPSAMTEVLLWKQFNQEKGTNHLTTHRLRRGSADGFSRGLVDAFLMKNGLPIYATNSEYKGDEMMDNTKIDRDERLQLFMFSESTPTSVIEENGKLPKFGYARLIGGKDYIDLTGYCQRKGFNYDPAMDPDDKMNDVTAYIVFRSAEAYLNYIEASYLLTNSLDADANKYWTALRARAGITAPIQTTIDATDMGYEADVNRHSYDWGAFSAGQAVDATLFSIRRERRSEFVGEGFRWDDVHRWCSLDQVKNYQLEGVNFWDKMKDLKKADGTPFYNIKADGSSEANISAESLGKHFRPFQIIKANNDMYNGYTFYQAHYLSPFSYQEMLLCSPTKNASESNLYQNPYWKAEPDTAAEK